jgi:hypothetical protein
LFPDLVGETLEIYVTGDPVITPTLDSIRKDLTRLPGWGVEYEILLNNNGVWGEPILIFNCLQYEIGDYIVARLTTDNGETLSVGVSRLNNGKVIIKMRPFFIPVNTYKIYLFLNRSWVPVLYPTTNKNNIILNYIKLVLPLINIDHYIKLDIYPYKTDTQLLEDVIVKQISKEDGKLEYQTINEYSDKSFSEYLKLTCILGHKTYVHVENNYSFDKYNIKTITEITTTKTDTFDVKIIAYNNDELIDSWQDFFIIGNCN